MTEVWIAAAGLGITILGSALYVGRLIGGLPGQIAAAVRLHERDCANFEPVSKANLRPVVTPIAEASDR